MRTLGRLAQREQVEDNGKQKGNTWGARADWWDDDNDWDTGVAPGDVKKLYSGAFDK